MQEKATIGAATAYEMADGLPADIAEKYQSVWRAVCRKAAEHGGHPALLAEAMVDADFALTMRQDGGNTTFSRDGDGTVLKAKGRVLTLTAKESVSCGLSKAILAERHEICKFLGGNQWVDSYALHDAVVAGDTDLVIHLLDSGMDVNLKRDGVTPLVAAIHLCRQGNQEMAGLLLARGADINARNGDMAPISLISFSSNPSLRNGGTGPAYGELVDLLLRFGADIDDSRGVGRTLLRSAMDCYSEFPDIRACKEIK